MMLHVAEMTLERVVGSAVSECLDRAKACDGTGDGYRLAAERLMNALDMLAGHGPDDWRDELAEA